MLSPSGRCYNYIDEVGPRCAKCEFENESEKVICVECEEDYILNNEKYCLVKKEKIDTIPNNLIIKDSSGKRRLKVEVKSEIYVMMDIMLVMENVKLFH